MIRRIRHWYKLKTSPSYRFAFASREGVASAVKALSQEPEASLDASSNESLVHIRGLSFAAILGASQDMSSYDRDNFARGYRYGVGSQSAHPSYLKARDHFAMSRGGYFFEGYKHALRRSGASS